MKEVWIGIGIMAVWIMLFSMFFIIMNLRILQLTLLFGTLLLVGAFLIVTYGNVTIT